MIPCFAHIYLRWPPTSALFAPRTWRGSFDLYQFKKHINCCSNWVPPICAGDVSCVLSTMHYLAGRTPNSSQSYKRNQRPVWSLQQHCFPLNAPFFLFASSLFCPPDFIPCKSPKHGVDHNQPKVKCEQRQLISASLHF